jgi:hypothetical protein
MRSITLELGYGPTALTTVLGRSVAVYAAVESQWAIVVVRPGPIDEF